VKLTIILFTVCALVIFGARLAKADEVSDLKEQLKALQETTAALSAKVQALEAKQEAQGKEIKKVPELAQKVGELKEQPAGKGLFEGVTVGGHLKFALLDRTQGERNGVSEHTDLGAGFFGRHNLILFLSKEIEDWLKIDVMPEVDATASATPSLGSDLGRASSNTYSWDIYQAFMTALLPKGYELKVGKFNAMFSEDYAKESWWHTLYNMPAGSCYLTAWHDFGAELYKNFDFDKWSLPIYFSVLNGNTDANVDNNEAKTVLLHIAPEFFQSKLRLLGSFGYGKWDGKSKDANLRSLGGFDWKYQKFNLTGEYIYTVYNNVVLPATVTAASPRADGERKGFWLRAVYTFNPKWRVAIQQTQYNMYKSGLVGQKDMLSDKWYTTDLALDYFLTPSSTIIAQYENGNGHRSDGSESLKFDRFTLGWRTTF